MHDETTPSPYARHRHLAIENSGPEPSPADFAAIESAIGEALPDAFREFLRVASGGYLEYDVDVRFDDGTTELMAFCSIFSARAGDDDAIIMELSRAREMLGAPMAVLPFARDGGGSTAFLDLTPEGNGRVVALIRGLPSWTGLREGPGLVQLAPSFEGYVEKLKIDRVGVIENLESVASTMAHVVATERFLDIAIPAWRSDEELSNAVAAARRRVADGQP